MGIKEWNDRLKAAITIAKQWIPFRSILFLSKFRGRIPISDCTSYTNFLIDLSLYGIEIIDTTANRKDESGDSNKTAKCACRLRL